MTDLAFAGSGMITVVHGLAVEAIPGTRVVAVASRSPEKAAERAKQLRARVCSYDELPAGASLVLVATPPGLHARHAEHALDRGAAVLLEKPLCTTLAAADALVAADPEGTRIGYAENLAFAPAFSLAQARVEQLGPLRHLEARSLQTRPEWGDFLTEGWGGGVLFDLGVHPLALVLLLAAPAIPVSVRATLTGASDIAVDEHAEVFVTFDSGLVARVEASWGHPDVEWDLQAASDDGVVRLELLPYLQLEVDGEAVDLPPLPDGATVAQTHQYGYVAQLAGTLDALATGSPQPLGVTFGRDVLDVVCAAYQSAGREGSPVALPFAGPRDRTPLQLWRAG